MNNIGEKITYISVADLVSPKWKATHTLRPNLLSISSSLQMYGFIQPIHVMGDMKTIIDGSERMNLVSSIKTLQKSIGSTIPAIVHDISENEAMMMHLQMNRTNGNLVAQKMSRIVKRLYTSGSYKEKDFDDILCMKRNELELMLDGSIFKNRKISDHNYSRAWVPVEAPPGTIDNQPIIERPPNPDR